MTDELDPKIILIIFTLIFIVICGSLFFISKASENITIGFAIDDRIKEKMIAYDQKIAQEINYNLNDSNSEVKSVQMINQNTIDKFSNDDESILPYNKIVSYDESTKKYWSQIEIQLQRRYDLIPSLTSIVEEFSNNEKVLLEEITKNLSNLKEENNTETVIDENEVLASNLNNLITIVYKYPELSSSQLFSNLMAELTNTENSLALARKEYNNSVEVYNSYIRQFPASEIAKNNGFIEKEYFKSEINILNKKK